MRGAVCLLLFVLACGWLACELPIASQAGQQLENPWRRTPHGWQKVSYWQPASPPYRPALHPAVVAALEILLSLIALVAFASATPAAEPLSQPAPQTADRHAGVFFDRLHRGVGKMKRRREQKGRRKRFDEAFAADHKE